MERDIDRLIDPAAMRWEAELLVGRYLLTHPTDEEFEEQLPHILAVAQVRVAQRAFEATRDTMTPAEQAEVARSVYEASVTVAANGVVARERPRIFAAMVRAGLPDPEAATDAGCAARFEAVSAMLREAMDEASP